MYITYEHRGTKYHVAVCRNCKASMTMTNQQFNKIHDRLVNNCLELLDALKCCDKPDFYWEVDWE